MKRIGIFGSGSWGCALALLLSDNGYDVTIWSSIEYEIEMLNKYHEQKDKLPGVILPNNIIITHSLAKIIENNEILVIAVPSKFVRNLASKIKSFYKKGTIIINASKGIEFNTFKTLSEQILEEIPYSTVGILSGPSHAEEVGNRMNTYVIASAYSKEIAIKIQNIFTNKYFHVYISSDIKGVEIGGALKNIIACAVGIIDGIGMGDNAKSALITCGIKEIASIGEKEGCKYETFYGLSGLGDLITTCGSSYSRNRKAGYLIGLGKNIYEVMNEVKMVIECLYSTKSAVLLADKYKIKAPIIRSVSQILFEDKNPSELLNGIMFSDF